MVFVDFGNPWLRSYLRGYPAAHQNFLEHAQMSLRTWRDESIVKEREGGDSRPVASVFDIDEVLLSNIHMNSFSAPAGVQEVGAVDFHAADVFGWPRGHRLNPLLPGAKELLGEVRRLEIEVFFVTGRRESIRAETVENFELVGLAGDGPDCLFTSKDLDRRLYMQPDTSEGPIRPFKEECRRKISVTHRIVLNIGDQVSDLGLYADVHYLTPHPFYFTA